MKIIRTTLALFVTLCLLTTATQADTITLKDGKILEGTIVGETDESVKIKIKLSATITDEKTIPREDIAEIKILNEEDLAFQEVQNLIPSQPLLTAADYANNIRTGPERFLATYPQSKYEPQVKKILEELEAEKAKAAEGSILLDGNWITAAEQRADRANVDSKILLYNMRRQAADNDYVGVLRNFDKMEAEFIGTEGFVAAIDLALDALQSYGGAVNASLSDFDARMRLREEQLQLLADFKRKENEATFAAEIAAHQAAVTRDTARGIRWIAFNANSKESLSSNAAQVAEATARIKGLDRRALAAAAAALDNAKLAIKKEDLKSAQSQLKTASDLIGTKGIYFAGIAKDMEKLDADLKARDLAARESAAEDPAKRLREAATGTTDVTTPAGNPLKAIMDAKAAELEKKKEKSKASAPGKAAPIASAATPVVTTPVPPPVASGGGISFQKIIFIIAGLLVVVTVGALVYQKQKG